jgi:hypothetical protein
MNEGEPAILSLRREDGTVPIQLTKQPYWFSHILLYAGDDDGRIACEGLRRNTGGQLKDRETKQNRVSLVQGKKQGRN